MCPTFFGVILFLPSPSVCPSVCASACLAFTGQTADETSQEWSVISVVVHIAGTFRVAAKKACKGQC
jgi:hypothetical protein